LTELGVESAKAEEALVVLVTALVCNFFALKHKDMQTTWNLVTKKANGWIKKETDRLNLGGIDWNAIAVQLLSK
jgi:hypothetical protein